MYESLIIRTLYNVEFHPVLAVKKAHLAKMRYNRILALIVSAVCAILCSERILEKR